VDDLRRPKETAGLRRVFMTLLDRIDRLNVAATELPEAARNLRLRLETAVILGLAKRLTHRLKSNDPLARRVKLTKVDGLVSILQSVFRL
jgi:hypothetical protein